MTREFILPVPNGLHNTNMNNIFADSLPLLTMLACVPTLRLFARQRKHTDLALYGIGFLLACIYHVCHMDEAGLIASSVLGVSGPIWRSADVYMAQWLLSRMWGHALKASHPVTSGVANGAFPALVAQSCLTAGQVTLGLCARFLLATMALTVVAKIASEGVSAKPAYPRRRGLAMMGYLGLAFAAFPMPSVLPSYYWVFHSVWHVLLAAGCYELYAMLYGEQRSFWGESRLCLSDLGRRAAQRLLAVVEISQPLRSSHGRAGLKEGAEVGAGNSSAGVSGEAFQEQLLTERWSSCDLEMKQQLGELFLFGNAS